MRRRRKSRSRKRSSIATAPSPAGARRTAAARGVESDVIISKGALWTIARRKPASTREALWHPWLGSLAAARLWRCAGRCRQRPAPADAEMSPHHARLPLWPDKTPAEKLDALRDMVLDLYG